MAKIIRFFPVALVAGQIARGVELPNRLVQVSSRARRGSQATRPELEHAVLLF
jgi:hypothetical protein